ncbi:MAG: hypothetical protein ACR2MP_04690 [Streptosporangiaceae bacterium]
MADMVPALGQGGLRVAVDGLTGAGKTSFGHELAATLRGLGRATMRASMDDFKYPWRHAREHGYDRVSGQGYYRNAYDFGSARDLLPGPAGPSGSGEVVLCGHDPLTGADRRDKTITAPAARSSSSTRFSHSALIQRLLGVPHLARRGPPRPRCTAASRGTAPLRVPRRRPACTATATTRRR